MDPLLRQRVQAAPTRATAHKDASNEELLDSFMQAVAHKLAKKTVASYAASIRDAIRYFRTPEGNETPARMWTKQRTWEYLQYIETNYCASFQPTPFRQHEGAALCKQRVWIGIKPGQDAVRDHCTGCSLFKRPTVEHRLNALNKWFKYLARVGAIHTNFMSDVVSEHYEETPRSADAQEKRRNPSIEEERALVNGTMHPQRRAFYASSAKWWMRPNEMLMLTRYESFGITPPPGVPAARGFENGHRKHTDLLSFEAGGDLVYLPETKGAVDKRKGNRWTVVDAELRPIIEQHFTWWERTVARSPDGVPLTSALWLNEVGRPLLQGRMYDSLFHEDAVRLGIVTLDEQRDPRRALTAHCQRHFGEKLLEMNNVPDVWCNHFRGDKLHDARGHYYKPTPQEVRAKYHEHVPRLGFKPLPDVPRVRNGANDRETHAAILRSEIHRANHIRHDQVEAASARLVANGLDERVPAKLLPSFLAAYRTRDATTSVAAPSGRARSRHRWTKHSYVAACERALELLA